METGPAIHAPRAPSAPPSGEIEAVRARVEAQLVVLDRLAEFGMQIVEAITRQLATPSGAPFAVPTPKLFQGDIVLAFSRVARAVRLSIALQSKLMGDLLAWERGEVRPAASTAEAEADADKEVGPEPEPQEGVEAVERLEVEREARDDIYAELDRPVGEVIDLICHDLGISPDWVRQAKADWAREDAAGDLGSTPPWRNTTPRAASGARPIKRPQRWPRASSA